MHKIQILGTGCPKCKKLAETAEKAAQQVGLEYEIDKVTDINQIMDFGVVITPGLALDGKVLFTGKVPSVEDVSEELKKAACK
ncbi:MAG: thioredoxin family protein [Thermovirgaceae bacterium]